jgi:hypothetical protein
MAHYDWHCQCCNWEGGLYQDQREKEYILLSIPGVEHKRATTTICSKCLYRAKDGELLKFHPWCGVIVGKHNWKLVEGTLVLNNEKS